MLRRASRSCQASSDGFADHVLSSVAHFLILGSARVSRAAFGASPEGFDADKKPQKNVTGGGGRPCTRGACAPESTSSPAYFRISSAENQPLSRATRRKVAFSSTR